MKRIVSFLILISMIFTTAFAEDEFISVYDESKILSAAVEKYIYMQNKKLFDKTGARLVVATGSSTGELSVHEYAENLYKQLGVGSLGRKNGIFLFICESSKDYHVIVAPGINASLTNQEAQKILSENLEKPFEKAYYNRAVIDTFNAFVLWYADKYDITIDVTDDMSEYKDIIRTENNAKTLKMVLTISLSVIFTVGILWYLAHRSRKKRMEKLRKKRQERRKRYMAIK